MPITRRTFVAAPAAFAIPTFTPLASEVTFRAKVVNPDLELDVIFTRPGDHTELRVPAFWAGGLNWRVRFSAAMPGSYNYRTECSEASLNGLTGELNVRPPAPVNPLLKHGAVRVAQDKHHFEHADGTPFFWLGDTWWMGLTKRMRWPDDFFALTADRVKKHFSVVQIIAGLYPDMPPFDERGANEAGYPWEAGYARLNPAYFDAADRRIQHLILNGIAPCIVGCWGYFLPLMGIPKMKQHWRNIIARWGAYPVIWCLAGEGSMPYYLSKTPKEDTAAQKRDWTEIGRYVRSIDSYHRMITIHPSSSARDTVDDPGVLDFDMLQTGHGDRSSIPNTVNKVVESQERQPKMPVLVGEVCYEGIMEASRQEVQRFMFWSSILNGAAGHTYGANGIWQLNTAAKPFGPSPHGRNWGTTPWDVAAKLPGSAMLGIGRTLLEKYEWWRFEPHPEWVDPHWSKQNYSASYAAGIPGEVRLIFIPPNWNAPKVKALEGGVNYEAAYLDPATGARHKIGPVNTEDGMWQAPLQPTFADWLLVLERVKA